jgi:hypothetical protein
MEMILTWAEIARLYDKEWVELVDYNWPEEEEYPRSGIVRVHAKTRKDFDKLTEIDPPRDSAFVFVGVPDKPANEITRSFTQVAIRPSHA